MVSSPLAARNVEADGQPSAPPTLLASLRRNPLEEPAPLKVAWASHERFNPVHELNDVRAQLTAAQQRVAELEQQQTQILWNWVAKALKFPEPEPCCHVSEAPASFSGVLEGAAVELGPEVGRGCFGTVHKVRNLTTQEVEAMKIVRKSSVHTVEQLVALQREFSITRNLPAHPNIARVLAPVLTDTHLLMRMEYAGTLDLHQVLKSIDSDDVGTRGLEFIDVSRYFAQACRGAAHLHHGGVCHLDIKPANIVLDDCQAQAKIVDFGLARHTRRPIRRMCGTLPYIAPEVMHSTEFDGAAADVWSLGSTLADLIHGVGAIATAMGWLDVASAKPSLSFGRELAKQLEDSHGPLKEIVSGRRKASKLAGNVHMEELPAHLQKLLVTTLCADPSARVCSGKLAELQAA